MKHNADKAEIVQGTLDMLILKTLAAGPLHGYAIARRIQQASADFFQVEEGSLYPALHRMERRGWIEAQWGLSEAKRKAKYYRLASAGRTQLEKEIRTWNRVAQAVADILGVRPGEA